MSFWNNPENNSLKTLIIVVVIALAGFFVYKSMNNGGDTGRVITAQPESTSRAIPLVDANPQQGDLIFSQNNTGTTCTMTITNALNLDQNISVMGMLANDGDCIPNANQDNQISQGMADAMKSGMVVNTNPTAQEGLIFSQTTSGTTCSMTVTNNLNQKESITVVGTIKGEDCVPNPKQANAISQGMADTMMGGVPVQ